MKKLSTALAIIAALGVVVIISFTVHTVNPRALRFLPPGVTDFMTEFSWLTWIGSAIVVAAVLARTAVQSALARRETPEQ